MHTLPATYTKPVHYNTDILELLCDYAIDIVVYENHTIFLLSDSSEVVINTQERTVLQVK